VIWSINNTMFDNRGEPARDIWRVISWNKLRTLAKSQANSKSDWSKWCVQLIPYVLWRCHSRLQTIYIAHWVSSNFNGMLSPTVKMKAYMAAWHLMMLLIWTLVEFHRVHTSRSILCGCLHFFCWQILMNSALEVGQNLNFFAIVRKCTKIKCFSYTGMISN
jgi:hypothetical protein